jgi:CHASE3 domain sensor protein
MTNNNKKLQAISRIPVILMLCVSLLIVCTTALLSYWNIRNIQDAEEQRNINREMRHQIMALLSVLKDAETGQRGFLLTGGEQYLEPYNNAISSISGQLALLHTLNALNSGPLTDLERLESLASAKLAELEESIKLYRYGKAAEARGLVGTNQGKALMDEIRVIGERIQQSAETRLASFIAVQNDSTAKLRAVSMLGSGLLFLFLIIAARVIHGGIIQRDLLYKESEATKNLFVTTLTGIADGVIATDTTAKVTFINPVAEELTGRSKEEALGKHIAEVFPVVKETLINAAHLDFPSREVSLL